MASVATFAALGAAAGGLSAAGLLPATAGDGAERAESTQEDFYNSAELPQRYAEALEDFEGDFPKSTVTQEVLQARSQMGAALPADAGKANVEDGLEDVMAAETWLCAWQGELLDAAANDDQEGVRDAGEQLRGWYDLEAVKEWVVDPGKQWEKTILEPALDGDTGPMQSLMDMCYPGNSAQE
ncbi:hypothetical protein JL108_07295 [Aeromicrobium sp. YIM 150415]|uniref:hypothetical protein n=1 Tax=Aeromicrobium sp. YIM 150415 TaxID=2803912 RepID=UPI0019648624|nr:hypothetical protein [Aeromicrobium sp. YIM 150415]MBM9463250.1 hypothetical protein [Aeromicrobium sp. YIM 150415]